MASPVMENSDKCGCNYTATKRISKTASITSISKTQRATRFNKWSTIRFIAVVLLMTQLLTICQVDAMAVRPRQLRKRHSIISAVDWENPCDGQFEGGYATERQRKKASIKSLRDFTRVTNNTLNATKDQGIDSDISMWVKRRRDYKFLPKLRQNSSIALKRWHRNMQTYVAALSYLYATQSQFDKVKPNLTISTELESLLHVARNILCEIESTINQTSPLNRGKKLTSLSLEAMNNHLEFRTKKHLGENLYQVETLDLQFVKHYFLEFVNNMLIVLENNKKIYHGSKSLSVSDSSYANSSSRSVSSNEVISPRQRLGGKKQRLGGKKQRPAKKQKPNKRQQRLQKNTNLLKT